MRRRRRPRSCAAGTRCRSARRAAGRWTSPPSPLRLAAVGEVSANEHLLRFSAAGAELVVFKDGRAIVKNVRDVAQARSLYSKYVGDLMSGTAHRLVQVPRGVQCFVGRRGAAAARHRGHRDRRVPGLGLRGDHPAAVRLRRRVRRPRAWPRRPTPSWTATGTCWPCARTSRACWPRSPPDAWPTARPPIRLFYSGRGAALRAAPRGPPQTSCSRWASSTSAASGRARTRRWWRSPRNAWRRWACATAWSPSATWRSSTRWWRRPASIPPRARRCAIAWTRRTRRASPPPSPAAPPPRR